MHLFYTLSVCFACVRVFWEFLCSDTLLCMWPSSMSPVSGVGLCAKLSSYLSIEKDKRITQRKAGRDVWPLTVCLSGLKQKCSQPAEINSSYFCFNIFLFSLGIPAIISPVLSWSLSWFLLYIWKQETICFLYWFVWHFWKNLISLNAQRAHPRRESAQSYIWTFSEKQDVPVTSLRWTQPPSVFCVLGLCHCWRESRVHWSQFN